MMRFPCFLVLCLILPVQASEKVSPLEVLAGVLANTNDEEVQRDVLRGMSEALAGRRDMTAPKGWSQVHRKLSQSKSREIRERVLALSVLFGDPQAMLDLKRITLDRKNEITSRTRALQTLIDKRVDGVRDLLRTLLDDPALRGPALRGLANFDDPKIPDWILARYPALTDAEKSDAISTLASRPGWALILLNALEHKRIARTEVTPFVARQIASLGDQKVSQRLNSVWGTIRPPAKDREKLLARYLKLASPQAQKKANLSAGRVVWNKTCSSCHVLFGEGGKIGPDLTGSQRKNPEYILLKVLDPGAVVPRDYQLTRVVTLTGRVITGVVKAENDKVITLQTQTEEVRLPKSDLESREVQGGSLMPEGQLTMLSDAEIRDLLAYLAAQTQVPLPTRTP